jgi:hypothetical protein
VVRYIQLAHNQRVGGVTQARVLANLGREDQLDRDGVRRLVASINRYLGEPNTAATDSAELVGDGLTVAGSRPVGAVHLLDGLWRALDVDAALRKVVGARRFTTDVERVLFALVANRAIEPKSKLSAAEWAVCDVAIDGLAAMDEDQAYRAMDLLAEADAQAEVQEAVFFAVADSTWRSTCCSSIPPPPTSNATPRRPARTRSGCTGTPRTTETTCRRS